MPQEFGLAPAKAKTPYGEMLQYYLAMEPQLFKTAVEDQLEKMREEKEVKERTKAQAPREKDMDKAELALYQRMEDLRANERRATLEDLMYLCILEKFVAVGVEMLPRLDGFVDAEPTNLKMLTEGLHSQEALDLVREHLLSVMGAAAASRFSTEVIKMSKFQMAQVYAASIMFGYFLRRVDRRFQLEKSLGTLPPTREEAIARLERLFSQADSTTDEDLVVDSPPESPSSSSTAGSDPSSPSGGSSVKRSSLRAYVESFDQDTMVETARIVSQEGAALVERQTSALFGDVKVLTKHMQEALGDNITSVEQLYQRIHEVVAQNKVETVTMTISTQRRAVLEAVAFGTFMRDVEDHVVQEYNLLTPLPAPRLPPPGRGPSPGLGGPQLS